MVAVSKSKKIKKAKIKLYDKPKKDGLILAMPTPAIFWDVNWNPSLAGRPKVFDTPQDLWIAACNYFKWNIANPQWKQEWKDGGLQNVPLGRPFTWTGLCIKIGTHTRYFNTFRAQLKKNDPYYEGFNEVIAAIENVLFTQKFDGAAVGIFKESLIAYDLGFKKDVAMSGSSTPIINITAANVTNELYAEGLKALQEKLNTIDIEAKQIEDTKQQ